MGKYRGIEKATMETPSEKKTMYSISGLSIIFFFYKPGLQHYWNAIVFW